MKQERVICHECELEGAIKNMYTMELFDTPWDKAGRTAYFHMKVPAKLKHSESTTFRCAEGCDELLTDHGWSDFRYFECEICRRMICEQNPANGWHSQERWLGGDIGDGLHVCLKCYEEYILENGVERESFETGKLAGMFFSGDNHEPLDAGYEIVEGINNVCVTGSRDAKSIIDKALELIDTGHKVIVGYESMAIGGLEGYVTLFSKAPKEASSTPEGRDSEAVVSSPAN